MGAESPRYGSDEGCPVRFPGRMLFVPTLLMRRPGRDLHAPQQQAPEG